MQYWNGNECKDCSDGCEKCIGSNAGDCEICISDLCKYGDRGCIACGSIENIENNKNTIFLSKNFTKLDEVTQTFENISNKNGEIFRVAVFIVGFFIIAIIITILVLAIIAFRIIKRKNNSAIIRDKGDHCRITKDYDTDDKFSMDEQSNIYFLNNSIEVYKKKIHKSADISSPINQVNVMTAIPQNTFSLNFPIKGLNEGRLLLDHKEIIGNGRFGTVYKCPYVDDGQLIWVAIKMTNYTNLEPAKEIETLLRLSHLNIVQLKAVNQKDNLILVMPLRQGNLKTFLKKEKDKITNYHQIRYCMQISDACRYMVHERIVHCDLKASNILVVNINHIEISDFGKSERLHQGRGKRVLGTVTHVAMELIKDPGSYTREATDVWSFGVTMWEIFTFGTKIPYYEELSKTKITEIDILNHLSNGMRLRPPEMLQANLHRIMITCWIEKHCERPTFNQLFHKFSKSLPEASNVSMNNILDESIDKSVVKLQKHFY